MSLKEVYEILINNQEILDIYNEIGKKENLEGYAFHNYDHILNVMDLSTKVLEELGADENLIYQAKIASLLHDVGAIDGKDGHTERSYFHAKKLFEEKNIVFDGMEEVLDAIRYHSSSFDRDNVLTLTLIFADKLDIKKSRITKLGKEKIGNRQYSHIEDILISIKNNTLVINFITDGNLDIDEFNEYYFTTKVFKSIIAFSKKMNLGYLVYMDNKEMDIGVYEQGRNI